MIEPHITILMATYNGARFLGAQLDSLLAQTHQNWSLVVSDDGSRDGTMTILRSFDHAHRGRNMRLVMGPCQNSPTQNFMALLTRPDLPSGMIALADQDDVWLPQKLARAVQKMSGVPAGHPTIYASESVMTDAKLTPLRQKMAPNAQPSFRNALVQNLFAGHSTVLNAAAVNLVQAVGTPQNIAFHDWWLYQLIAGAGGVCLLDPAKTVLYRQHGGNAFGAAHGVSAALNRLKHLLRNDYSHWLAAHWQALQTAAPHLTPDACDLVHDLMSPDATEHRAAQFQRLGLHRGSSYGTTALNLAARLGRV